MLKPGMVTLVSAVVLVCVVTGIYWIVLNNNASVRKVTHSARPVEQVVNGVLVPTNTENLQTVPSAPPASNTAKSDGSLQTGFDVDGAMNEVASLLQSPASSLTQERLRELQDQLTVVTSADANVRQQLIDLYKSDSSALEAEFARGILSQINAPEVVAFALSLTDSSQREDVLNGLSLFTEIGASHPDILIRGERLLDTYQDDTEVVHEALDAMRNTPAEPVIATRLADKTSVFLTLSDSGIRSASIFAIGRWAQNDAGLAPVIQALDSEDVDDRLSAAMALEQSSVNTVTLRDVLLRRTADGDELWEVRRMAADSLQRFELDDQQQVILTKYRLEQERISTGG